MVGSDGWLWKEQDERPAAAPDPVVNPSARHENALSLGFSRNGISPICITRSMFALRNRSSRSFRRRRRILTSVCRLPGSYRTALGVNPTEVRGSASCRAGMWSELAGLRFRAGSGGKNSVLHQTGWCTGAS